MSQIIDLTQNSFSTNEFYDTDHYAYLEDFEGAYHQSKNSSIYEDTLVENELLIKENLPNKILFSLEETAAILGLSYDYVRNLANLGRIASKQFGKRKLIHIKELSRLITEGVN